MTAPAQKPSIGQPVKFDPLTGEILGERLDWNGKRRELEVRPSRLWRYPFDATRRAQYASFEAWHPIAMQILHQADVSFRCIAVFRSLFNWSKGVIETSYADIARRGGGCSEKTVQRELVAYQRLGIIQVEMGWRRLDGARVKTRTLRLALPERMPESVEIGDFETDHSGLVGGDHESE